MSRISYIRFGTYAVLLGIAAFALRPKDRVIEVGLAESGYDYVVRSLLKKSSEIPAECVSIGGSFPELRPVGGLPDGLSWKFQDGPDFYIWRASDEERKSGAGIYFGHWPDFAGDVAHVEVGQVGKEKVVWCKTRDSKRVLHFECQFVHLHDRKSIPLKLHVWVYGESEGEVRRFASTLASLTLEEKETEPNQTPHPTPL